MKTPLHGLYAITDGPRNDLLDAVGQALAGGARLLQYRDKRADGERRRAEVEALARLCRRYHVPLIINGDVALAHAAGADGVHLGRGVEGVAPARAVLGEQAIIGVACGGSFEQARAAVAAGADYVSFGAFFPSVTKPHAAVVSLDLLRQAGALGVPVVAIGGITPDNGGELIRAGADCLAVVSALFGGPGIHARAQRFARLFSVDETSPT